VPDHPWHDVPLSQNSDEWFPVFIEIPKESKVKYELDKETGLLMVNRLLYSAVQYPANYGFVPRTYCPDEDRLYQRLQVKLDPRKAQQENAV
jgi:inorganic pyrophosphatase